MAGRLSERGEPGQSQADLSQCMSLLSGRKWQGGNGVSTDPNSSGFASTGGFGDVAELESGDLLLRKPYRRAELAKAVHDLLGPDPSSP
jgi:hypothetical protein